MATLHIYAGGLCNENAAFYTTVASGFIVVEHDELLHEFTASENNTTSNRMEILAVLNSFRFLKNNKIDEFVIFSNSEYVCNSINKWIHLWRKNGWRTKAGTQVANKDLLETILSMLAYFRHYDVRWIKEGDTIPWNEYLGEVLRKELDGQVINKHTN